MSIPRHVVVGLALQLCAACNSGDDGGAASTSFDDAVPDFVSAICDASSTCGGQDRDACVGDVTTDMDDAKAMLDAAGLAQCTACMQAKTEAIQAFLGRGECMPNDDENASVDDACKLTPDGDDQEACAGFP